MHALPGARGEHPVPEERQLLPQRGLRVDHPVDPPPLGAQTVLVVHVDMVPEQDVLFDLREPLRVEKVFHDLLVPPGGVLLQLVPRGSEARAAHQVGDEGYLLLGHSRSSLSQRIGCAWGLYPI